MSGRFIHYGPGHLFAHRASYNTNKTKEYDAEAMRYLSYVLYPLVSGRGT